MKRVSFFLNVAFFTVALVIPLASARDTALERELQQLHDLIAAGRLVPAYPAAAELVRKHPGNAEAHDLLGICLSMTGREPLAIVEYQAALALNPASPDTWEHLGTAYSSLKQQRKAAEAFQKCLRLDPKRPRTMLLLARAHHDNADDLLAIPVLEAALRLDPHLPQANYLLAKLYGFTGKPEAAVLQALDQEIAANPRYAPAHAARGTLFYQRGDFPNAKASYRKAVEMGPSNNEARLGLARIAIREGQPAEAIVILKKLLGESDMAEAHLEMAHALLKQGRKAEADKELIAYRRLESEVRAKHRQSPHTSGTSAPIPPLARPAASSAGPGVMPSGAPSWFVDVAAAAGIHFRHATMSPHKDSLLEAINGGSAFLDYDNDGWLDVLLVGGKQQSSRLFHNNRDGAFTDVTAQAGITHVGWGMGATIADYDNDGYDDVLLTYFGGIALYHNNGNGTFTDVTAKTGLQARGWASSAAWGDYDRDGRLDLFVASYIEFDPKNYPRPGSKPECIKYGIPMHCGPEQYPAGRDMLFHNNGDGTFSDVTEKMHIEPPPFSPGLAALWVDVNGDGWPDLYVANDERPSALYLNQGGRDFLEAGLATGVAVSDDGRPQAGMGVDAADYAHEGRFSIVKTNFSQDAPNLYRNVSPGGTSPLFVDDTYKAGVGEASRLSLGFGVKFLDFDNDGWIDLCTGNGHIFPQVDMVNAGITYRERNLFFRNLGGGKFEEIGLRSGPGPATLGVTRSLAAGDFNNDGRIDLLVGRLDDTPLLLENRTANANHWISLELVGVKSNRNAIGALVHLDDQMQEVRANDSFLSSSDRRVHFGLGRKAAISRLQIRWPSGLVQDVPPSLLAVDSFYRVREGEAPKRITFEKKKM